VAPWRVHLSDRSNPVRVTWTCSRQTVHLEFHWKWSDLERPLKFRFEGNVPFKITETEPPSVCCDGGSVVDAIRALNRVKSAFVGLLGGNLALLLFLLQNAIRLRADLLAMHMGEPARQIPFAVEMWVFYVPFSFVGWLFVGVPIALIFPASSIKSLSWILRVFIGAALGPLALFLIFALLSHGHIQFGNPGTFTGTSSLWAFSILISTVSFLIYVVLLGER